MMRAAICPHKWSYRAGVISFGEGDQPSGEEPRQVMIASKNWLSLVWMATDTLVSGSGTRTKTASSYISAYRAWNCTAGEA
ncbi:hypothetical protein [Pelagimonas varians]|uniref:Uncharacterized protein n=1 Tax=Pelagimonas varians TaxID=696760 RepID=A0A238KJX1_9RHOB|nr:hypothetical protein [Pelagimonas varians]SMX43115.1 hypothetical protein PEV8663_02591 [Pelagimonas varians]